MDYREGPWIVEGHVVRAEDQTLIADLRRKPSSSAFESHVGNMHLSIEHVSDIAELIGVAPVLANLLFELDACLEEAWNSGNLPASVVPAVLVQRVKKVLDHTGVCDGPI